MEHGNVSTYARTALLNFLTPSHTIMTIKADASPAAGTYSNMPRASSSVIRRRTARDFSTDVVAKPVCCFFTCAFRLSPAYKQTQKTQSRTEIRYHLQHCRLTFTPDNKIALILGRLGVEFGRVGPSSKSASFVTCTACSRVGALNSLCLTHRLGEWTHHLVNSSPKIT